MAAADNSATNNLRQWRVYLPSQFLETQNQGKALSQGRNSWVEEEERRSEQAVTCTGASNAAPVAKATLGCRGQENEQGSYRPWQIPELSANISTRMHLLCFYLFSANFFY